MLTMWETNSMLNMLELNKFQDTSRWLLLFKSLYVAFTVDYEQGQSVHLTLLKSNSLDAFLPKSALKTDSSGCSRKAPYSMSDWVLNTPACSTCQVNPFVPNAPFLYPWKHKKTGYTTGIHILKVNKRNTRTRCETSDASLPPENIRKPVFRG